MICDFQPDLLRERVHARRAAGTRVPGLEDVRGQEAQVHRVRDHIQIPGAEEKQRRQGAVQLGAAEVHRGKPRGR